MKNGHPFALFPDIPHNSDQLSKPSAVEKWGETFFEGAFLCPIHVVTFTLISKLATDYIQKRRGQALLFSFE